jgi:phosphoribosyl 1,2-cyclic phosphate phosphodiesterase
MKITFLGTGTSHGVPPLDCMINNYETCPQDVCRLSFSDPKHRRTRSSVLIETDSSTIIIDISEDFRFQALREQIKKIDYALITHAHADHVGGIPDIRSYTIDKPLPLYGSEHTVEQIQSTFSYIFDPMTFVGGGIPSLETVVVNDTFYLDSTRITPITVEHGRVDGCFGYRIGNVGYIPDMKSMSEAEMEKLKGLDVLILNCLRRSRPHSTHLILPESIALAQKLKPSFCYFIHMSHDIHYQTDSAMLESWMQFSYDGLKISI